MFWERMRALETFFALSPLRQSREDMNLGAVTLFSNGAPVVPLLANRIISPAVFFLPSLRNPNRKAATVAFKSGSEERATREQRESNSRA